MAVDTYQLIREAILNKQQIMATYDGYYRELCPHVIGVGPRGNAQALFVQFGGGSSQGEVTPNDPRWKCMSVSGLTDVEVRDGEWYTIESHSQPQTCVKYVDLEVKY